MKSTIFFTPGAKGGTGKSTIARFVITYLKALGLNPLLLDMDDENRTMSRFFPEARQIEISKRSSYDVLIEAVVNEGAELIVADLKAGTGREVLQWWAEVPFDELSHVKFICVAAITSSPDSVQSALNWAAELKNRVSYVICKNCKDGEIFPDYDESVEALNFRGAYRPGDILMPRLDAEYMTELERLNLTIPDVLMADGSSYFNGKEIGDTLSRFMVRARLKHFQQGIYDQLGPIVSKFLEVTV